MAWTDPNDPRADDVLVPPMHAPCACCGEPVPTTTLVRLRCQECRALPYGTQQTFVLYQRIALALEKVANRMGVLSLLIEPRPSTGPEVPSERNGQAIPAPRA